MRPFLVIIPPGQNFLVKESVELSWRSRKMNDVGVLTVSNTINKAYDSFTVNCRTCSPNLPNPASDPSQVSQLAMPASPSPWGLPYVAQGHFYVGPPDLIWQKICRQTSLSGCYWEAFIQSRPTGKEIASPSRQGFYWSESNRLRDASAVAKTFIISIVMNGKRSFTGQHITAVLSSSPTRLFFEIFVSWYQCINVSDSILT